MAGVKFGLTLPNRGVLFGVETEESTGARFARERP